MKKLNLLLLEDEEMDAALIKKVLERAGIDFEATVVSNKSSFLNAIGSGTFDAILADNSLPQFDATDALQTTKKHNIHIPFILVTGTVSEEFAVNIMKGGACDYILKDRLQRLPGAVLSAISKHSLQMLQQKNLDDLIKNEALMKKSEELARFGSWEADLATNTYRWSDENYRILNYEPGEVNPSLENFLVKLHPGDLEHVEKTIKEAIDHLSGQKFKCRVMNKDGSVTNLENEVFITRNERGKAICMNGFSRDITETALALDLLQKSDANLRTIFDNADTGYVLLDTSWNIVSYNQPIYQFSLEQLEKTFEKGDYLLDAIKTDKHDLIKKYLLAASNGLSAKFEISYLQDDDTSKWYAVNCSPVLDNDLKILGIIISERDITRKKLLELQEKNITADLMQRNSDLEQFAYIVSHNLRGPVATILGISEIIHDDTLTEQEKIYFMESLIGSVKKLDNVIIDLNHIIHAKTTINEKKELVNFSQLVHDITTSIRYAGNDKLLNIKNDFAEINEMMTIKSYMHSIFYNLISNSVKYRQQHLPLAIEIKSRLSKDKLELIFKDNGMGIDLNKRGDQVFGLYKRFHTGAAEGKGLGLFMVKTQVETLGGKISITSEVNTGTEFRIEFEYKN